MKTGNAVLPDGIPCSLSAYPSELLFRFRLFC